MYDEDTIDNNDGIHNMSTSSDISESAMDEHVEVVGTEKADMQDEDCMRELERREVPKDNLRTTETGDIVRILPYTIPRKQR